MNENTKNNLIEKLKVASRRMEFKFDPTNPPDWPMQYRDSDGGTALHVCCNTSDTHDKHALQCAKILIRLGLDINRKNNDRDTPLTLALNHHVEIAKLLIMCEATIGTVNKFGWSPIMIAADRHPDLVPILIRGFTNDIAADKLTREKKKNVAALLNKTGRHGVSSIHYIVKYDRLNLWKFMVEYGADINTIDHDLNTVLHRAAQHDAYKITKECLGKFTRNQVNHLNAKKRTALHNCLTTGPTTTSILLIRNTNLDIQDEDRETFLHKVARAKENQTEHQRQEPKKFRPHQLARLLILHNIDTHLKNKNGQDALEIASATQNWLVMNAIARDRQRKEFYQKRLRLSQMEEQHNLGM